MCVANINATTQPCDHRWAHLVQPCDPSLNLETCPKKIRFSGWEQKHETCPWCTTDAATPAQAATHKLFGTSSSPISSLASPDLPDFPGPRKKRSGSDTTIGTLSRHSSVTSIESEWAEKGQRHRDMNERLAVYLTSLPHEVLPSAKKFYPTYSSSSSEESSPCETACTRARSGSNPSKGWKKGVRFSKNLWKG